MEIGTVKEEICPYVKHDPELVEMLGICLDELHDCTKYPLLLNMLSDPSVKNLTVKEMLEREVKAKADLEEMFAKRKAEREAQ